MLVYNLKMNAVETDPEVNFTRRIKVMVKGDLRFDYTLDETEFSWTVVAEKGQEIKIEYWHDGDTYPDTLLLFEAGGTRDEFDMDFFSISEVCEEKESLREEIADDLTDLGTSVFKDL